jgi:hypothetical protein
MEEGELFPDLLVDGAVGVPPPIVTICPVGVLHTYGVGAGAGVGPFGT